MQGGIATKNCDKGRSAVKLGSDKHSFTLARFCFVWIFAGLDFVELDFVELDFAKVRF